MRVMKRSIVLMFAAGTLFFAGRCNSLQAQDTNVNSSNQEFFELSPSPTIAYYIKGEKFMPHLKQLITPKTGESDENLVLRYFKEQHIEMKWTAKLYWITEPEVLVVHATGKDQGKIKRLLSKNFSVDCFP